MSEKDETLSRLILENAHLKAENEKLKAERDVAVEDIPKHCGTCKHFFKHEPCSDGGNSCEWEWRGVKEEE